MMKRSRRFFLYLLTGTLLFNINLTHTIAAENITTFYVVQHAEQETRIKTKHLTIVGAQRAEELRRILHSVPLAAVYSTEDSGDWETVLPTASAVGLKITPYEYPILDFEDWVGNVKKTHKGTNALIVGNSKTVPAIVKELNNGRGNFQFKEEYDNLFVVTIVEGEDPKVQWRRYSIMESLSTFKFNGQMHEEKDISAGAVSKNGNFLIVGADEGTEIQILKRADQQYDVEETIALRDPDEKEIDIEGITRHGNEDIFYAMGSHSEKRKNISRKKDEKKSYTKIKKRFEKYDPTDPDRKKPNTKHLIRFQLNSDTGKLVPNSIIEIPLRNILDQHRVLKHFSRIPSKENGIDIEGIASDGENLYLGFRGPVLRHGFTPVLVFPRMEVVTPPKEIKNPEVRYVNLDGRGIRDMTRVEGGFLIVAGPVGEAPLSYQLYFWDGYDCLPGKRASGDPPLGKIVMLGTISTPVGGKPEAIVLLSTNRDDEFYEVMILYDGIKKGNPTRFRASQPNRLHVNASQEK